MFNFIKAIVMIALIVFFGIIGIAFFSVLVQGIFAIFA